MRHWVAFTISSLNITSYPAALGVLWGHPVTTLDLPYIHSCTAKNQNSRPGGHAGAGEGATEFPGGQRFAHQQELNVGQASPGCTGSPNPTHRRSLSPIDTAKDLGY